MDDPALDPKVVKTRLRQLNSSTNSIQTMSMWITHHHENVQLTSKIWAEEVCNHKAKSDWYLAMMYLANDVVQNARKDGRPKIVDEFFSGLKTALTYLGRHKDKLSPKGVVSVERVIKILGERKIYKPQQVAELQSAFGVKIKKTNDNTKLLEDYEGDATEREKIRTKIGKSILDSIQELSTPPSTDSATRKLIATYPETIADKKSICPKTLEEAQTQLMKTREAYLIVSSYTEKVRQEKEQLKKLRQDLQQFESFLKIEGRLDKALLEKAHECMVLLQTKKQNLAKQSAAIVESRGTAEPLPENFIELDDL
ncbi:Rprd1b [Aphelenchoides besseyi]|nr:Rprd1b [Aphelenchoides besseyi]